MKVEYVLVAAVVGAVWVAVKQWLPDFPGTDTAFLTVVLYLLANIGVEVADKPANALRNLFEK